MEQASRRTAADQLPETRSVLRNCRPAPIFNAAYAGDALDINPVAPLLLRFTLVTNRFVSVGLDGTPVFASRLVATVVVPDGAE